MIFFLVFFSFNVLAIINFSLAPYIAPPNFKYQEIDGQTIYLIWEMITVINVPGKLLGYQVTYRKYDENTTTTFYTSPPILQKTVVGLKPFT